MPFGRMKTDKKKSQFLFGLIIFPVAMDIVPSDIMCFYQHSRSNRRNSRFA